MIRNAYSILLCDKMTNLNFHKLSSSLLWVVCDTEINIKLIALSYGYSTKIAKLNYILSIQMFSKICSGFSILRLGIEPSKFLKIYMEIWKAKVGVSRNPEYMEKIVIDCDFKIRTNDEELLEYVLIWTFCLLEVTQIITVNILTNNDRRPITFGSL